MQAYKLVRIEKPPAEAWREMKQAANELAASLTACWQDICQQVKETCGQNPYMAILPDLSVGRTSLCVRVSGAYIWLPRSSREHWDLKASQVREAIEKMASVTKDLLQRAADESLEQ